MPHALEIGRLTAEEVDALDTLYRTTTDRRERTRAHIVLLAGEQGMTAPAIAKIVRETGQTVHNWFKRYVAEGRERLRDRPMLGAPGKITKEYAEQLETVARRRPRSMGQPYSLWTLQRLADFMAEETGIRVSYETVRRTLAAAEIMLSRPHQTITSPDPEYLVKKAIEEARDH